MPITWAPVLGPLVGSAGNDNLPVHRWFRYKEAYSADLLESLFTLTDFSIRRPLALLDPYCGVGTTLLSAQVRPVQIASAIGVERNPFAAFVARTKLGWPRVNGSDIEEMSESVLSSGGGNPPELPELSSIRTGRCITKYMAGQLLLIRDALLKFPQSPTRDALLVGLASSIEPLSRVRKDGRALRLVDRTGQRIAPTLRSKWTEIRHDISSMKASHRALARVEVKEGDGRALQDTIDDRSIDVVLTSPPYPNNIDYSEVYKLELWLLGFVNNGQEFLQLRKSTLRSHPTCDLISDTDSEFREAITTGTLAQFFGPLLNRTGCHKEKWRGRLALAYFSDLWISLKEQYRCLRGGGRLFMVLGNSLHGHAGSAYLVPTDLLVAQLARKVGFQLVSILVARNTKRRLSGNHFLRESVLVIRKPENV